MAEELESKEVEQQPAAPASFEKRFNVQVDFESAKKNFINRVFNFVDEFFKQLGRDQSPYHDSYAEAVSRSIAFQLGVRFEGSTFFEAYAGSDFYQQLKAIEALYVAFKRGDKGDAEKLNIIIVLALDATEVDLGIEWKNGNFYRSGAKLLDKELVDEPMHWLDDLKYGNVLEPFQKGLKHYVEANKDASKLSDTITDIYEAFEAMARIVNKNNSTLGANADKFVGTLGLSDYYSKMLKDYCGYAHEYRHAAKISNERTPPKSQEVEAFIYTTGLFIRLAVRQLAEK